MIQDRLRGGAYAHFPEDPQAYHEGAAEAVLKALFDAAVIHAEDRIGWYERKASERARVAKRIRLWSLVLFAVGTLAPIVATLVHKLAGALPIHSLGALPYAEVG